MSWKIVSPDFPYLEKIGIYQVYDGFFSQILPYAPLASAAFSALSIIFAYLIASKARSITAEQKRIAEQKLDLDLFDKRSNGIRGLISLRGIFSEIINKYRQYKSPDNMKTYSEGEILSYINDISKKYNDSYRDILMNPVLFSVEDSKKLLNIDNKCVFLYGLFTGTSFFTSEDMINLNGNHYNSQQIYDIFEKEFDKLSEYLELCVKEILPKYTPNFFRSSLKNPLNSNET